MKKLSVVFFFLLCSVAAFSQGRVRRSTDVVTVEDARAIFTKNLTIPVQSDTTLSGGLDSVGSIMFSRFDSSFYVRSPRPGGNYWARLLTTNTGALIVNLAQLNATTVPLANQVYYLSDRNKEGFFYHDALDVSTVEDSVMTVVSTNGKRFKRIHDGVINLKWFGAVGNLIADDTWPWQKAMNYQIALNKDITIFVPVGNYKITNTIAATFSATSSPKIIGEGKGRANEGSTLVWYGPTGGTMMRLRRFHATSIENIDFNGNNGTGSPTYPKYLLHIEVDGAAQLYSSFIKILNCSFGGAAGDSSANINLNGTGSYTNYQCSEVAIEHCNIHGNGFNIPAASQTWYGVMVGGFNTKNFYLKNNYASSFVKAWFKTNADAGAVHSADNVLSVNEWNFDISSGTQFVSMADYTESSGGLLKAAQAATPSNFTIINYSWFCSNLTDPNYPILKEYIIEGRGQLNITGSTFFSAASTMRPKINWNTDDGLSSLMAVNNNFSGIKEGVSPFYSSGNPILTQDRQTSYGQYISHRVTSIGNVGINNAGTISDRFPNGSSDDMLVRGLSRVSASIGKPDGSTNNPKRWHENDISIDLNTSSMSDSRHRVKYWVCTRQGTFKTISITGSTSNGTKTVSSVSNIAAIEAGDILTFSGNVGNTDYRYTVSTVNTTGNSFTYEPFPANATGVITITNAVPVFSAFGGAFGIEADKPALTANDVGFQYFSTTTNTLNVWDGVKYVGVGSPEHVNVVTQYNAKADSTGDDAPFIRSALLASVRGQTIFFPKGKYLIKSDMMTTTRLADDVTIEFEKGAQLIFDRATQIVGFVPGNNNVFINVNIDGRERIDSIQTIQHIGISNDQTVFKAKNVTITGCNFERMAYGIRGSGAIGWNVTYNRGRVLAYLFHAGASANYPMYNNKFLHNYSDSTIDYSIVIYKVVSGSGWHAWDNDMMFNTAKNTNRGTNGYAFGAESFAVNEIRTLRVNYNTVIQDTMALVHVGRVGTGQGGVVLSNFCQNCEAVGNTLTGPGVMPSGIDVGIYAPDGDGNTIDGNNITGFLMAGIEIPRSNKYAVTNNVITDCGGQHGAFENGGIALSAGSANEFVTNSNISHNTITYTPTYFARHDSAWDYLVYSGIGIQGYAMKSLVGTEITHNKIVNNINAGILLQGYNSSFRITGFAVKNNRITNSYTAAQRDSFAIGVQNTGIYIIEASDGTIAYNEIENPSSTGIALVDVLNLRVIGNKARDTKTGSSRRMTNGIILGGSFASNNYLLDNEITNHSDPGFEYVDNLSDSTNIIRRRNSYAVTQPTTGYYYKGEFVGNTNINTLYAIEGWRRLTTGNTHVDLVDWAQVRAFSKFFVDNPATYDTLSRVVNDSTLLIKSIRLVGSGGITITPTITDSTVSYAVAGGAAIGPQNIPVSGATQMAYETAANSNHTAGNVGMVILPQITANRKITLPISVNDGTTLIVKNENVGASSWLFSTPVKDKAGGNVSTVANTTVYWLISDNSVWKIFMMY